jgi:hypothetical protein
VRLSLFIRPVASRLVRLKIIITQMGIRLRGQKDRAIFYFRDHPTSAVVLVCAMSAFVVVIVFRPILAQELGIITAYIAKLILHYANQHPGFLRFLHILLGVIPDFAFLLLGIAGLSYLMPEVIHKFETSKALRLSACFVFGVFCVAAIILNAVNREEQDHQQQLERDKLDAIGGQITDTLGFLSQSKGQPNEVERRRHVLDALRSRYILEHPEMSADIIAGNANPPSDWINNQLKRIGEEWPYTPPRIMTFAPAPRSFVVWADRPRFSGDHEGDPLSYTHVIGFNLYYKQSGPNSVEVESGEKWLYTRSDASLETQKEVIGDFLALEKSGKGPPSTYTLMPNENPRFFTAFAPDETNHMRLPRLGELDDLKFGREIIFILAKITYKDSSSDSRGIHHLPLCLYLQPPATPPGIWHYCEAGFNNSD